MHVSGTQGILPCMTVFEYFFCWRLLYFWVRRGFTFSFHADCQTLLEAAGRTTFSLGKVHRAALLFCTSVMLVILNWAFKESLQRGKEYVRVFHTLQLTSDNLNVYHCTYFVSKTYFLPCNFHKWAVHNGILTLCLHRQDSSPLTLICYLALSLIPELENGFVISNKSIKCWLFSGNLNDFHFPLSLSYLLVRKGDVRDEWNSHCCIEYIWLLMTYCIVPPGVIAERIMSSVGLALYFFSMITDMTLHNCQRSLVTTSTGTSLPNETARTAINYCWLLFLLCDFMWRWLLYLMYHMISRHWNRHRFQNKTF